MSVSHLLPYQEIDRLRTLLKQVKDYLEFNHSSDADFFDTQYCEGCQLLHKLREEDI